MDPNAALRRWREAIMDRDHEEAKHALNDLRAWIRKGGALPTLKMMPHEKTALGVKNPRKCRGRGPEKKRVLVCRGKRDNPANPRRIGESDGAYAKRLESDMRDIKKRMGAIASKMKKIAKPRANPENPRRHFPKTKRGRPAVGRRWSLTAFDAAGKKVLRESASTSKDNAFKQAKAMVGKHYHGHRIAKVILDGPK